VSFSDDYFTTPSSEAIHELLSKLVRAWSTAKGRQWYMHRRCHGWNKVEQANSLEPWPLRRDQPALKPFVITPRALDSDTSTALAALSSPSPHANGQDSDSHSNARSTSSFRARRQAICGDREEALMNTGVYASVRIKVREFLAGHADDDKDQALWDFNMRFPVLPRRSFAIFCSLPSPRTFASWTWTRTSAMHGLQRGDAQLPVSFMGFAT
jgi:hypothetical protein